MNPFIFLRKSLAAKLVLAFILVAVPPMLLTSYLTTRLVTNLANANIKHWLQESSRHLMRSITDKEERLAAIHTLEDSGEREARLAGLFTGWPMKDIGQGFFNVQIFLPDGDDFRQEYASAPPGLLALPPDAIRAIRAGAEEYLIFDDDWMDKEPDVYFLFSSVRDDQGELLAVFAVSLHMLPHDGNTFLLWSIFFSGILLSGCVGYTVARTLISLVRRLAAGARSIADGNHSSRVTVQGNDEIAELAADFNHMAEQLVFMRHEDVQSSRRERHHMLGEVAVGFAHEVRNPLLVIKTSTQLVHSKLPDRGKEAKLLGFVIEEVNRIDRLIFEFLSFAKPAPLNWKHFQLDTQVSEVLELTAAECAARGVVCSFVNDAGQSCRILGDADKIHQMLLNLLLNSMDAMPQGGSLNIRLYVQEHQPYVCCEVRDTGDGIAEELLPTVHLPFVSSKNNGLGLGLAKVYAIVEAHEGHIACQSTPGQGTVFTICLKA